MTDADRTPDLPGIPSWSTTRIGDRDGGVSHRLTLRCRAAASVLGGVGVLLLVVTAIRSWSMVSAGLALIAMVVLIGAVLLTIRARMWSEVARSVQPADGGSEAIVGAPRPLSPGVPGAPVKRRLGAVVVPVHQLPSATDGGPQPGAGALIVHARADALALADHDGVRLWQVGADGLARRPSDPLPRQTRSSIAGRFVLIRDRDAAVFLGTTRLTDTW